MFDVEHSVHRQCFLIKRCYCKKGVYQQNQSITLVRQSLFLDCGLDFWFAEVILYTAKSPDLLNHKINNINTMLLFFLNILCDEKALLNWLCWKTWLFSFSLTTLDQSLCNLWLTITCDSHGCKRYILMVFELLFIFDCKPSNSLISFLMHCFLMKDAIETKMFNIRAR